MRCDLAERRQRFNGRWVLAAWIGIGAAGQLEADAFYVIGSGLPRDAEERILYNSSNGALLHDADGNGAGLAVVFAVLTGVPADVDFTDLFVA